MSKALLNRPIKVRSLTISLVVAAFVSSSFGAVVLGRASTTVETDSVPLSKGVETTRAQLGEEDPVVLNLRALPGKKTLVMLSSASASVLTAVPPRHGELVQSESGHVSYRSEAGYLGPDRFELRVCNLEKSCETTTVQVEVVDVAGLEGGGSPSKPPGEPGSDEHSGPEDHVGGPTPPEGVMPHDSSGPPAAAPEAPLPSPPIGNAPGGRPGELPAARDNTPTESLDSPSSPAPPETEDSGTARSDSPGAPGSELPPDDAGVRTEPTDDDPLAHNTAPVAENASYTGVKNGDWIRACVLQRATDSDADPLVISRVGAPTPTGKASIGSGIDGEKDCRQTVKFEYPDSWAGVATIDFEVSDGRGGTATATLTVTIPNSPPKAAPDPYGTVDDTNGSTGSVWKLPVLCNDSDPDHDDLVITKGWVSVGSVSVGTDPSKCGTEQNVLLWDAGSHTGPATFSYTVTDGLMTATTTGEICIEDPVNPVYCRR